MHDGCRGTTKAGQPCRAPTLPGEEWCRNHHPDWAERRTEWQRKGGTSRSNRMRAQKQLADLKAATPAEVVLVLTRALVKVEEGKMEPNVGNSLATISKALLGALGAVDWDERLAELERRAGVVRLDDRRTA